MSPLASHSSLLTAEQLNDATDEALCATIAELVDVQKARALRSGDPAAIADAAFEGAAFDFRGLPETPWLEHGMLVCPGVKVEKSKSSHDCVFVHVGESWSWDHEDCVYDEMRQLPNAAKTIRRSISVVLAPEGLTFDVVASSSRGGGPCRMTKSSSYEVRGGVLVETNTRTAAPSEHR